MKCPCCAKRIRFKIKYKGKQILVQPYHTNDQCSKCGKIDPKTEMHHTKYDDNDPLANTLELCNKCHHQIPIKNKATIRRDIEEISKKL
jgi:hypothetical protein